MLQVHVNRLDPSVCRDIREMKDMPPLSAIRKNTQRKDNVDVSTAFVVIGMILFFSQPD